MNWHRVVGMVELALFCSLLAAALTQHERVEQPAWSWFFPLPHLALWQGMASFFAQPYLAQLHRVQAWPKLFLLQSVKNTASRLSVWELQSVSSSVSQSSVLLAAKPWFSLMASVRAENHTSSSVLVQSPLIHSASFAKTDHTWQALQSRKYLKC